jgi:BioD-like phosphotransacetylase family protein
MQGARDVSSKMRLILHDKTSGSTPAQLKQNIELGLNGFAGARDGLSRVRFIVDLEA